MRAVVFFHYFPSIIPNGYLGVDLFFVISGFLISLYIFREVRQKKFTLLNFYNRRIKRIIPATIFLLFFFKIFSILLFTKFDLINFSKSLFYSIFFSSNFFFWLDGGYFGANDKLKPLLHLWSLAVEEQFYIFFPIIFYFILKFSKKIEIIILIVLFFILSSLVLNIYLVNLGGQNPAFFLLPTRIWNFGFGILAMLLYISKNKFHTDLEIIFYILMIIIGFVLKIPYLPENFIIILFSLMILKKKFPKKFILHFLFHNKVVQYIGIISFSLYLWHWPMLVFLEYYYVTEIKILSKFIILILSILFSILSYHLIEFNFRYKYKIKNLFKLIFVSYSFFILFFLIQNLNNEKSYKKNSSNYISQANLTNYKCESSNFKFYFGKRGCLINDDANIENYEIALIGNSHAQMYVPSIRPHLKSNNKKAILLPMNHCLPTLNINLSQECIERSNEFFSDYSNDDNIKTVIIATSWWHKQIFDGSRYIDDPHHKLLAESIIDLIEKLKAKEKRVFLIGPIQVPQYDLPQELSRLIKFKHINEKELLNRLEVKKEIYDKEYNYVNNIFNKKLGNYFLQMNKYQCDEKKCYYYNSEGIIFADGSHISKYGASLFSKSFEIIFK